MPDAATSAGRTDSRMHPAAEAWQRVRPGWHAPDHIEMLKKSPQERYVYRLGGAGPKGTAIIAKRCWRDTALLERTIYEDVLPRLPVSSLRYYGYLEEPENGLCWIFLEDAGSGQCSFSTQDNRALAARWLGSLHVSAAKESLSAALPDRGPDWYLEHLRAAREGILENIKNPALQATEVSTLRHVLSQLDHIEARWSRLERFCSQFPKTLVHGDFSPKNVGLRCESGGITLLPYDWEKSGWALPAKDLTNIDIEVYSSIVKNDWPEMNKHTLIQLLNTGKIFLALSGLNWACGNIRRRTKMHLFDWYKETLSKAIEIEFSH